MLRLLGQLQRRVLPQNGLLQPFQLVARLQADLLSQLAPRRPVDVERLGLAGRAIQSEHQLVSKALPQRVTAHERLEFPHELGVAAGVEIGVDPLPKDRHAQLLEASDFRLRK